MGLNEKNENEGLIFLSLDSLFEKIYQREQMESIESEVQISYIEIYKEKVYDLLAEKCTDSILPKGKKYQGSTKISIKNSLEAKEVLKNGNKNRHVRSTLNNASSSRSHAMFSIHLFLKSSNSEIASVLHLVDLAGSEGLRNTNHQGIAQQEGIL
jgi:hypothetical protein